MENLKPTQETEQWEFPLVTLRFLVRRNGWLGWVCFTPYDRWNVREALCVGCPNMLAPLVQMTVCFVVGVFCPIWQGD